MEGQQGVGFGHLPFGFDYQTCLFLKYIYYLDPRIFVIANQRYVKKYRILFIEIQQEIC